jgi:hypothetical protein
MTVDSAVDRTVRRNLLSAIESQPTIIDVIQELVRVLWVVNDQRSTQTIAVLSTEMGVIPERASCLATKFILETVAYGSVSIIDCKCTMYALLPGAIGH